MFINRIEENLNSETSNVYLLVMLPLKMGKNVLKPFPKKCLLPWMLPFLKHNPISRLIFRGEGWAQTNDLTAYQILFQTNNSQHDSLPISQLDNLGFIIRGEAESSGLDTENASLPTTRSHNIHKGETETKNTALVLFEIVYSRHNKT